MRITIKSLQEELKRVNAEASLYKRMLDQVHQVVFKGESTYSQPFDKIFAEVVGLKVFQATNQGAYRPETETIHILKEIIRWKINPETAMESKVQEGIDGFRRNRV